MRIGDLSQQLKIKKKKTLICIQKYILMAGYMVNMYFLSSLFIISKPSVCDSYLLNWLDFFSDELNTGVFLLHQDHSLYKKKKKAFKDFRNCAQLNMIISK